MQNQNIVIRDIIKGDFPQIGEIYARAFNNADVGENWQPDEANKLLKCDYSHKPNIFLVAEVDKKIIAGFFGTIKPYYNKNDLCDTELFVDPAYQKTGIGRRIFREMLKKAVAKYNISDVQGIADSVKDFPVKWYKKIGLNPTRWVFVCGSAKKMLNNLNKDQE